MIWSSISSLLHHGGDCHWFVLSRDQLSAWPLLSVCPTTPSAGGCTAASPRLQLPQDPKCRTPFHVESCFAERISSWLQIAPHPTYLGYESLGLAAKQLMVMTHTPEPLCSSCSKLGC